VYIRVVTGHIRQMRTNRRSTAELTTLDSFLKEEGRLEEFEAVAIQEVLVWQLRREARGRLKSPLTPR